MGSFTTFCPGWDFGVGSFWLRKIYVYETDFASKPVICSQGMFASEATWFFSMAEMDWNGEHFSNLEDLRSMDPEKKEWCDKLDGFHWWPLIQSLLSIVFGFHYHSQEVIGSLGGWPSLASQVVVYTWPGQSKTSSQITANKQQQTSSLKFYPEPILPKWPRSIQILGIHTSYIIYIMIYPVGQI